MQAEFENDGTCTVSSSDGTIAARFPTVYEPAFNRQYDQPLTEDGSRLLIGNWEGGLFCYDAGSGDLLWRQGPGSVRQLILSGETVVAEMYGRGVWQRDLVSGEVLARVSMSGLETFVPLQPDLLFVGPRRRDYYLLDLADLSERTRIPVRLLNPDSCLAFRIERARRLDTSFEVSGTEGHPNGKYSDTPSRDFSRVIEGLF